MIAARSLLTQATVTPPTVAAEDGARQTLFSRANTYVQGLVNLNGTLYLFTTDSPSTEHGAGTVAAVRTIAADGTVLSGPTTIYSGGGAGRQGAVESVFVTSTGRILVGLDNMSDSNFLDTTATVMYSDDGSTYSSPYTVPNTFDGESVCGDFVELPNHDILLFMFGTQTGVASGNSFVKVFRSTDNGATFGSETIAASSSSRSYQEPNAAWVAGEVVVLMRSDTNAHTWRMTSTDGAAYSTPADVVALSGPPDFLQWFAFGYLFCMARNDNTQFRPRWATSLDIGATWGSVAEVDTGETRELDGTGIAWIDPTHFLTVYALANSSSSSTVYLRRWVVS